VSVSGRGGVHAVSRLDGILRDKELRARELRAALASAVDCLRELGALKVTLFGSLVSGETDVDSDLDLLVVMPATRSGREWTRVLYERVPGDVAIDLLVYAENEWGRELRVNTFLRDIQARGEVVYEKTLQ
jgi:predicted nucleotidyltransferase